MIENLWNESAFEFFEEVILKHCRQMLPGGKRWLRLHEVEKLIDIPGKELLLLIKGRKLEVAYIGDYELFDYVQICEVLEGQKCGMAPPELKKKFG
jgi:hypothetical protein